MVYRADYVFMFYSYIYRNIDNMCVLFTRIAEIVYTSSLYNFSFKRYSRWGKQMNKHTHTNTRILPEEEKSKNRFSNVVRWLNDKKETNNIPWFEAIYPWYTIDYSVRRKETAVTGRKTMHGMGEILIRYNRLLNYANKNSSFTSKWKWIEIYLNLYWMIWFILM